MVELKEVLKSEGIVEFEKDMRGLRRSEIKRHFGSRRGGIVFSRLVKSVIWQGYQRIQSGQETPVFGNLRTFWYRFVKPALAKVPKKYYPKTDLYDLMTGLFSEMVLDLKLFKYSDFDFTDENWENRRIGTRRPEILLFAEKRGWIRILREYHEQFGVSILALGGFSSTLTSEYTARDINKVLPEGRAVRLCGIVDYDPSGSLIASSFRAQLERADLKVESLDTLIHPKHYTRQELEFFRFRLPKKQKTKLSRWLELTGGIDGKPYGLEAESMPLERLRGHFQVWLEEMADG